MLFAIAWIAMDERCHTTASSTIDAGEVSRAEVERRKKSGK
jgi:hypothetical protein